MMAVSPESVDLAQLHENVDGRSSGIIGEDPRDSTAALGEELIEKTLDLIGAKLDELGV